MFRTDDRSHHRERIRAELDLAYRADSRAAAEAHLRLSALHMKRLVELGEIGVESGRPAEFAPNPC